MRKYFGVLLFASIMLQGELSHGEHVPLPKSVNSSPQRVKSDAQIIGSNKVKVCRAFSEKGKAGSFLKQEICNAKDSNGKDISLSLSGNFFQLLNEERFVSGNPCQPEQEEAPPAPPSDDGLPSKGFIRGMMEMAQKVCWDQWSKTGAEVPFKNVRVNRLTIENLYRNGVFGKVVCSPSSVQPE